MAKLILISLLIVGIAILLLGIRVFFTKKGEFPSSHVSAQPALRKKGITCHREQHTEAVRRKGLKELIEETEQV